MGERVSWKMHRGNLERTGSMAMTLVSIDLEDNVTPEYFRVSPNYPNPFNPSTTIDIQTSKRDNLDVRIFDARGNLISVLINENMESGHYVLQWSGVDDMGRSMPTGIYFLQVRSGAESNTQKMIMLK